MLDPCSAKQLPLSCKRKDDWYIVKGPIDEDDGFCKRARCVGCAVSTCFM